MRLGDANTRWRALLLISLCTTLGFGVGCKGSLQQHAVTTTDSKTPTPNTNNSNAQNNITQPPVIDPDLCAEKGQCGQELPSKGQRVIRMTHLQWEQSVQDLLSLDAPTGLSGKFYDDPLGSGNFDNDGNVLEVTNQLWDNYREAAEALAADATRDSALIAGLLEPGSASEGEAQARAFAEQVGLRAWRRPLTEPEVQSLLALYKRAPEMFSDGDMHRRGVELILRTLLQSPHFIYRVELSNAPGDQPVSLNGYERASKLAMTLWSSIPDAALLKAAADGELDNAEGVAAQATRMLEDERAKQTLLHFYRQLYKLPSYEKIEKNAERFPSFSADTGRAMRLEMERFIEDTVFTKAQGLSALLTSRTAFVNQELAAIYGLQGDFDQSFKEAQLPDAERAGLLTRLGFLAYNGTAYEQNSIHRGVFINHHVLCAPLPPAPAAFELPDVIVGQTNRQRIESATAACGGACHNVFINPAGFAFEHYDGIGAYQKMEGEHAVDASSAFQLRSSKAEFKDAVEFSQLMATSIDAHECNTRHMVEFLYGKVLTEFEEPLVKRLGWRSLNEQMSIKDIIVAAVSSPAFLTRQPSAEVQP